MRMQRRDFLKNLGLAALLGALHKPKFYFDYGANLYRRDDAGLYSYTGVEEMVIVYEEHGEYELSPSPHLKGYRKIEGFNFASLDISVPWPKKLADGTYPI